MWYLRYLGVHAPSPKYEPQPGSVLCLFFLGVLYSAAVRNSMKYVHYCSYHYCY